MAAEQDKKADDSPVNEKPPRVIDVKFPLFGKMQFEIPHFPGEDQVVAALKYADTKIPTIRGRPFFAECARNAKSGMTVALVSLPLSISLAIAADATPVQGIITACWAGLISAIAGGSHYNIVGPTGALSGILSYYSVTYGSGIQPILAILTGVLSALVYLSRMDKYLVFIPSAVMHGFTMGVSFIIAANQLNFILGLPKLKRHPEFLANLYETMMNVGQASGFAIVFFGISFTALFMLSKKYGKIPWAVVLAILGILIGAGADASKSNMPIRTIRTAYGDLSLELIKVGGWPVTSDFDMWMDLFKGAVSITAVAVLETLISARIADRMTKTIFDQKREVLSVSLANLASGFLGGIPATAALARTALNIKSGATSRASGIVNGFSVIILSTALFSAFKFLPLPIVGTILVNTAIRMLEIHEIVLLFKTDFPMFIVAVVTALICIVEDPTMGIVYGTFLAMIRMLLGMLHGHASLRVYQGTRCELTYLFGLKDRAEVKAARRRLTLELDDEDKAAIARKEKADHAHASGAATSLGSAAAALRKVQDSQKVQTIDLGPQTQGDEGGVNPDGHYTDVPANPEIDSRLPRVAVYSVSGFFTYITAQSHLDRIRDLFIAPTTRLPEVDVIVFDLSATAYADPDAMDAMGDLIGELSRAGRTVFMLGFVPRVRKVLAKVPWFGAILSFRDYGSLLVHLRDVIRLEDEKAAAGLGAKVSMQEFLQQRIAAAAHANHAHGGSENDEDDDGGIVKHVIIGAPVGGVGAIASGPSVIDSIASPAKASSSARVEGAEEPQGYIAPASVVALPVSPASHSVPPSPAGDAAVTVHAAAAVSNTGAAASSFDHADEWK